MTKQHSPVNVEQVQWQQLFGFLVIFKSFWQAIQPRMMLVALVFVILMFIGGFAADLVSGPSVYEHEVRVYATHTTAEYDAWLIKIFEGDQFWSGFVELNPNSKIPALLDQSGDTPFRVFESGAILLHLAVKQGQQRAQGRAAADQGSRRCGGPAARRPTSA